MPAVIDIAVMALSHLGTGKSISDLDTDQSEEGRALRTFKDVVFKKVASAHPWPEFRRLANAALVEVRPNSLWQYSYRKPPTDLVVRRVLSGQRVDTRESRIPFDVGADDSGGLIYTDMPNAIFETTKFVENPSLWTSDYCLAVSYLWAFLISNRLTKGDPNKIKRDLIALYTRALEDAAILSFNEGVPDLPPDAEWLRNR